ncbi:MAG: peptidoglycan DD-metalloendopeptidase family protein [Chitinophagales bacterium]|nr:peptidoglycan DD-metalloendopeptidase family protein [Chitinophagales bacterium]
MKAPLSVFLFLLFCSNSLAQTPRFVNPVEGIYGQDFIIVNYVDWESTGILDHQCGSKTYDGHQGTDFVLKSFPQMDAGVAVLAVDTSIVIAIHDGEFDRETVSDPAKGLGNFIGLKHSGDLYTYYGHLKTNSLLVEPGEVVLPGQKIAEIASSGNSSDPHLHFELWYDSLIVIDPFAGDCGNTETYWLDPIPYDDSYGLWESGLIDFVPTLNDLQERPEEKTEFTPGVDSIITFWTLQYGLLDGDISQIEWFTPTNDLWLSWDLPYEQDWWYHYFWAYIDMPSIGLEGNWRVVYSVNEQVQKEDFFTISSPLSTTNTKHYHQTIYYSKGHIHLASRNSFPSNSSLELYDLLGRKLVSRDISNQNRLRHRINFLPTGIYIAAIVENGMPLEVIKLINR